MWFYFLPHSYVCIVYCSVKVNCFVAHLFQSPDSVSDTAKRIKLESGMLPASVI